MIEEYVWALFAQSAMRMTAEWKFEKKVAGGVTRFDPPKSVSEIAEHSADIADSMLKEFKKRFRKTPWNTESKPETENVYENKS